MKYCLKTFKNKFKWRCLSLCLEKIKLFFIYKSNIRLKTAKSLNFVIEFLIILKAFLPLLVKLLRICLE